MPSLASWIEKKFLSGPARSPTATILPLRSASLSTPEFGARQHAHAAAMGAGHDLDVKALLQRLQPAQRHAEAGVGLAGGDGFKQLVGRTAVVDELDVEILLLEEAVVDRDRHRRKAHGAGVPRQLQLARRARQRCRIRRRPADREFREIDGWRCSAKRQRLRADDPERRRQHRCRAGAQQRAPVQPLPAGRCFVRHCSSPFAPRTRQRSQQTREARCRPAP